MVETPGGPAPRPSLRALTPLRLALVFGLAACQGAPKATDRGDGTVEGSDETEGTEGTEPQALPYNDCGNPGGDHHSGSWEAPTAVAWPYVDRWTTVGAVDSVALRYDCAPEKSEAGPEVVYSLVLDEPAWVRLEVADEADVDVDVHLLDDPQLVDGLMSGCIERHDRLIERWLEPGQYLVAVDTFEGAGSEPHPGDYSLSVEVQPDGSWIPVELAPGVTWSRRRDDDGELGRQTWNVLRLAPEVGEVGPVVHDGCEAVGEVARGLGAFAGINASFFSESCGSRDFVRRDGVTSSRVDLSSAQRALLWDDGQAGTFEWVEAGADHEGFANGLSGYPSVVNAGSALLEPELDSTFALSRHPRTALGIDALGHQIWFVADGRTGYGDGLTLPELALVMVGLGAVDAVNLDGGGSTTMFVEGCSTTGLVNFPSDGGGDRAASRAVSDGLYWMPAR